MGGITGGRIAYVKTTGIAVFVLRVSKCKIGEELYPASSGWYATVMVGPARDAPMRTERLTIEELSPVPWYEMEENRAKKNVTEPRTKGAVITMAERAKHRPPNFASLDAGAQWAVDKELGILDWDGSKDQPLV